MSFTIARGAVFSPVNQSGVAEFAALLNRLDEVERHGQEAVTCKLIDLIRDIFDPDE